MTKFWLWQDLCYLLVLQIKAMQYHYNLHVLIAPQNNERFTTILCRKQKNT